jgi:hypothetical protein
MRAFLQLLGVGEEVRGDLPRDVPDEPVAEPPSDQA